MKIAFFDTKPYDKPSFDKFGGEKGVTFKYFETKLNEDTVNLARGYDGVCAFVNDTINDVVIVKGKVSLKDDSATLVAENVWDINSDEAKQMLVQKSQ